MINGKVYHSWITTSRIGARNGVSELALIMLQRADKVPNSSWVQLFIERNQECN